MGKTLAEFLKVAGVSVAASVTPAAPAKTAETPALKTEVPASAKTAEASAPVKETGKGRPGVVNAPKGEGTMPASDATPKTPRETAKKAAVQYDPNVITTLEQKWLLEQGIVVPDAKTAEIIYKQQVAIEEQQKMAEFEALAENERAKGALQYHGMLQESAAMRFSEGLMGLNEVVKVANWTGVNPQQIVKRAEQLVAANPAPALVDGHLGTAARITSAVQAAAEANANTTQFQPEAVSGTRAPAIGDDEKLKRFTEVVTLPGNPGLNHGQQVDQGKGYGK